MSVILAPNQEHIISCKGHTLIVRSVEGDVTITPIIEHERGTPERIESGDVREFATRPDELVISNIGQSEASVKVLTTNQKVRGQGQSSISVANAISVKSIIKEVSVQVRSGGLKTHDDVTIGAGQTRQILGNTVRKEVLLQVLSEQTTVLRVGDQHTSAVRGMRVSGSVSKPASMGFAASGAVYVCNASTSEATISITEVI